jgi:hypothetical protein
MDLFGPMTAKAIHVNACSMYVTAKLAIAQSRMLEQCLGFRSERYATGNAGEIERIDAQPIACEHKPSATRVPQCDREHAVELVQKVEAEVLVQMDEDLSVRMIGGEPVPGTLQRFSQLHVIVDLAVEDDRDRPILVEHRLLACRHVDDGEAPHAQRNVRTFPIAGSVRAAMT